MKLTRRRMLSVTASVCLAGPARASRLHRMQLRALGADCQITLPGNRVGAERAVQRVRAEIEMVEDAFSLYRTSSELSRLNLIGSLVRPSRTFLDGWERAAMLSGATRGAFDVTVQSLWNANLAGTDPRQAPVDWQALEATRSRVRFTRPDMAATFNGIAQGIATDRAVACLERLGYCDVLANLGEFRGLGHHPDGRAWQVGVHNPVTGKVAAILTPTPEAPAIATSEPYGTKIAGASHIFDPAQRSGPRWASVTIRERSAAIADGLSTAIAASPMSETELLLDTFRVAESVLIDGAGKVQHHRS